MKTSKNKPTSKLMNESLTYQDRQGGKTADWLFISRVLALSADQSKAAQVN